MKHNQTVIKYKGTFSGFVPVDLNDPASILAATKDIEGMKANLLEAGIENLVVNAKLGNALVEEKSGVNAKERSRHSLVKQVLQRADPTCK